MSEVFVVDVDSTSATASLNSLDSSFKKVTDSGNKAADAIDNAGKSAKSGSGAFNNLEKALTGINRPLESLMSGLSHLKLMTVVAAEGFIRLTAEITKYQAFLSMMTVTVGTIEAAKDEFTYLFNIANKLGVPVDALTKNFGQFQAAVKGSAIEGDKAKYVFESFATMTRALHLTTHDTTLVFYALTQMMSKGVVSMEELRRQLGEKMPGAMNLAARAVNTTMAELEGAIRKGTVDSGKLLYAMSQQIMREYSIPATIASQALDAQLNRVHNTLKNIIVTMYDLGVASSFSDVLKEINRIMSDPAVAKAFATIMKDVAEKLTEFLRTVDGNYIKSTMDSLKSGLDIGATAFKNMFEMIKSMLPYFAEFVRLALIMKGIELGASVGMAAGAAYGAVATPQFMGLGAIPGGAIGAAAGGILGGAAAYGLTSDMKFGVSGGSHGASGGWEASVLPGNEPINNMSTELLDKMSEKDIYLVNGYLKASQTYNDMGRKQKNPDIKDSLFEAASSITKEMYKNLSQYDPETYGQSTTLKDVLNNGGKANKTSSQAFRDQLDRMLEVADTRNPIDGLQVKLNQLITKEPKEWSKTDISKATETLAKIQKTSDENLMDDLTSSINKDILSVTTPTTESQAYQEAIRKQLESKGRGELFNEPIFKILFDKLDVARETKFQTAMGTKAEGFLDKIKDISVQYDLQATLIGKTADEQARANQMFAIQKQIQQDSLAIRKEYESKNSTKEVTDNAVADFNKRANADADKVMASMVRVQDYQKSMIAGARRAFAVYEDLVSNVGAQTEALLTKSFKGMEDALVKFVQGGKLSFKSLADSIIADLIRIAIRASITGPMFGAFSGVLGGGGGGVGSVVSSTWVSSAQGNVFDGGHAKFAKGGSFTNQIVDSPTFISFGKGAGFGEIGEAGPEAVMPLTRDRSGNLGVRAQTDGDSKPLELHTHLTINAPGADDGVVERIRSMMPGFIAENKRMVEGIVVSAYSRGGGRFKPS